MCIGGMLFSRLIDWKDQPERRAAPFIIPWTGERLSEHPHSSPSASRRLMPYALSCLRLPRLSQQDGLHPQSVNSNKPLLHEVALPGCLVATTGKEANAGLSGREPTG